MVEIRRNPNIRGIKVGEEDHKLAAYADDILFFITSPRITLLNLMKSLKEYGEILNFKMNPAKSETLNINALKPEEHSYQKDFPFVWGKKELKYLGVEITTSTETLYQLNFLPLLNDIKLELHKTAGQLSWMGRNNIFKMVILPKIMYKMQMLPIPLPQAYFKTSQTLFSRFIWQGKKTRISLTLLTKDRAYGGLGAPDLRNYYNAILLS